MSYAGKLQYLELGVTGWIEYKVFFLSIGVAFIRFCISKLLSDSPFLFLGNIKTWRSGFVFGFDWTGLVA